MYADDNLKWLKDQDHFENWLTETGKELNFKGNIIIAYHPYAFGKALN